VLPIGICSRDIISGLVTNKSEDFGQVKRFCSLFLAISVMTSGGKSRKMCSLETQLRNILSKIHGQKEIVEIDQRTCMTSKKQLVHHSSLQRKCRARNETRQFATAGHVTLLEKPQDEGFWNCRRW
jgi:hypothetical protein